jgi:hypothetical protein
MIQWSAIQIIGLFVVILILILGIVSALLYQSILKDYNNKQYDKVIIKSDKYLCWVPLRYRQFIILMKSFSYLFTKNQHNFHTCMNSLSSQKMQYIKFYWLSFQSLIDQDYESAKMYYLKFKSSLKYNIQNYPYEQLSSQLDGVFHYLDNEYVQAKPLLELSVSNASSIYERDYYKKILDLCNEMHNET